MIIEYDGQTDLLYIRLNSKRGELVNKRVTEDIVLDIGEDDKIVGIEILDASQHVSLNELLSVSYQIPKAV
jgi:uncharacterized protein YuzE